MQVDRPKPQGYLARWGFVAKLKSAVVRRLESWLGLHLYYIYAMPLVPTTDPDPEPEVPGCSLRIFAKGDERELLACAKRPELGLSKAFVHDALGKGDVCNAVMRDGEIVSFDWAAFTPTHVVDGVYVEFPQSYRYGYFAFTLPELRGRHLWRAYGRQKMRYCMDRGCTHTISYVAVDNLPSIRSGIAMGRTLIGLAGYLKFGSVFVPFSDRSVRECGLRFCQPSAAPVLAGRDRQASS